MTPLSKAIAAAEDTIQYCHDELEGDMTSDVGWGGMTYEQLSVLVDAVKTPHCCCGECHIFKKGAPK